MPDNHVRTLHGLREQRIEELLDAGFETIEQLPEEIDLRATAARQVRSVRTGKLLVEPGLAGALDGIVRPAAFLDFESVAPAIPVWPGCQPYGPIPVQMSCHVEGSDGALSHHFYLAKGPGDPRPAIAAAVVRACEGTASVVVYNASFERRCLDHLAATVPDLASQLGQISSRLTDLFPIVRNHVYHPNFGGSFSLKSVLPALVPDLDYGDLTVSDGAVASAFLETLLLDETELAEMERQTLRRDLLAYCERDTVGMVRLLECLRALEPTVDGEDC